MCTKEQQHNVAAWSVSSSKQYRSVINQEQGAQSNPGANILVASSEIAFEQPQLRTFDRSRRPLTPWASLSIGPSSARTNTRAVGEERRCCRWSISTSNSSRSCELFDSTQRRCCRWLISTNSSSQSKYRVSASVRDARERWSPRRSPSIRLRRFKILIVLKTNTRPPKTKRGNRFSPGTAVLKLDYFTIG